MSDLQLGLLAIGAVVVIAVLAFNKWQEVRFRREAEGSLKSHHDDVLMGDAEEPAAGRGARAGTAGRPWSANSGEQSRERVEPTFDDPQAGTAPTAPGASEEPSLTQAIDFIVPVEAAEDLHGEG